MDHLPSVRASGPECMAVHWRLEGPVYGVGGATGDWCLARFLGSFDLVWERPRLGMIKVRVTVVEEKMRSGFVVLPTILAKWRYPIFNFLTVVKGK